MSQHFKSLLRKNAIKHETVERGWRSLFEMALCLLLEAKFPKELWAYGQLLET